MPLFSVIMPTYNRAAFIETAIRSVLAQTFQDFEIVIVDDGSTDDTEARVTAINDPRVRYKRQANAGPGPARNHAIELATGTYCAFLDSDDVYLPWSLENTARAIREFDQPAMIAGTFARFWKNEEIDKVAGAPYKAECRADHASFLDEFGPIPFATGAMTVRTDAIRKVGGFSVKRLNAEDIMMWLTMADAPRFAHVSQPAFFGRRKHDGNMSDDFTKSLLGVLEMVRAERAGEYPGRSLQQRRGRAKMIAHMARSVTLEALRGGDTTIARKLYCVDFVNQVRFLRMRYLLASPLWYAKVKLRRLRSGAGTSSQRREANAV